MHRGWMDGFKPEPFTEREAFLWSIERAAFQSHDQWFNGHRITVARGEFVTSLREMEKSFGWSMKRIRGFMDRMGKAQKWAQRRAYDGAQSPTIISVCNYAYYQNTGDTPDTVEGTAKGTRGARSGHSKGTQQKEGNKGNKVEEESPPNSPGVKLPQVQAGEIAEDPPRLLVVVPPHPAADDVGTAFAAFEATRREFVPGGRQLSLSLDRRKKLACRLREFGGLEGWNGILADIRGSPFLRGETSQSGFVAEIDWLLEPKNLRKVVEGRYNDRSDNRSAGRHAAHSTVGALNIARNRLGADRP